MRLALVVMERLVEAILVMVAVVAEVVHLVIWQSLLVKFTQ
jgi:hypothetical protein